MKSSGKHCRSARSSETPTPTRHSLHAQPQHVAVIASADQAHTHDPDHKRFGFSPAAAQFDAMYCKAIRENHLERLLDVTEKMLIGSWADSPWQTLILAGALDAAPMQADLISYAVPSYYGMVVAVYEPAPPAAKP